MPRFLRLPSSDIGSAKACLLLTVEKVDMSFSADKVPVLKTGGGHRERRFSTSKEPSGNGECIAGIVKDDQLGDFDLYTQRR